MENTSNTNPIKGQEIEDLIKSMIQSNDYSFILTKNSKDLLRSLIQNNKFYFILLKDFEFNGNPYPKGSGIVMNIDQAIEHIKNGNMRLADIFDFDNDQIFEQIRGKCGKSDPVVRERQNIERLISKDFDIPENLSHALVEQWIASQKVKLNGKVLEFTEGLQ